jgi:hypothetical protein
VATQADAPPTRDERKARWREVHGQPRGLLLTYDRTHDFYVGAPGDEITMQTEDKEDLVRILSVDRDLGILEVEIVHGDP